ncbi:unnamed protein product [Nippostrongylus brasiliensis]|uniref:Hva1_TUDOR domain-containing protein n=1 Tax=Nippostrongylus brasiliensis TaxID=27835 RepID=A0A0N4Y776_NIPBR|nr:unnamed protein product [Nippostrongylus brasiliensis]
MDARSAKVESVSSKPKTNYRPQVRLDEEMYDEWTADDDGEEANEGQSSRRTVVFDGKRVSEEQVLRNSTSHLESHGDATRVVDAAGHQLQS